MPIGLSFAVAPEVRRLPPSLVNIFQELQSDLGLPQPSNGDLTPWTSQGVLLLNRALTTRPGSPGSHRGKGWEEVTEQAIRALAERGTPLVSILWGSDARSLRPFLSRYPVIESVHPSPRSADRGFFNSAPSAAPTTSSPSRARPRWTGGCRSRPESLLPPLPGEVTLAPPHPTTPARTHSTSGRWAASCRQLSPSSALAYSSPLRLPK